MTVWDSQMTLLREHYPNWTEYIAARRECDQHYDYKVRVDGGWMYFEFEQDWRTWKEQR